MSRGELALSLAEREARLATASAGEAWRAAGLVRDASAARARVAARALHVAEARYREGLLSMTELTRAARGEVEARLDLLNARFEVERAALRWRLALGREPLEEGGI